MPSARDDFDAFDQVDPFFLALLRCRQRRFEDCATICTDILSQNPYDQVRLAPCRCAC
jgi:hypothetical protein